MISDKIIGLIQAKETVSSVIAQHPDETPSDSTLASMTLCPQF